MGVIITAPAASEQVVSSQRAGALIPEAVGPPRGCDANTLSPLSKPPFRGLPPPLRSVEDADTPTRGRGTGEPPPHLAFALAPGYRLGKGGAPNHL